MSYKVIFDSKNNYSIEGQSVRSPLLVYDLTSLLLLLEIKQAVLVEKHSSIMFELDFVHKTLTSNGQSVPLITRDYAKVTRLLRLAISSSTRSPRFKILSYTVSD